MRFTNWVLAGLLAGAIAAPSDVRVYHNGPLIPNHKLPPSHARSDGGKIVELFLKLRGSTEWKLISKTPIEGDTGEPEGMVLVGNDRLFVSSGQWTEPTERYNQTINGTDCSPGAGFMHLLLYDTQGHLLANSSLTKPGEIEYHGGGLDYDGRYIWITLSQYRPNSTATIARIDPLTLKSERLFRTNDHNGGIVHDTVTDNLVTLSWGSRNATTWSLKRYPRGFAPLPGFTHPSAASRIHPSSSTTRTANSSATSGCHTCFLPPRRSGNGSLALARITTSDRSCSAAASPRSTASTWVDWPW
ncbi:hypothetical protein VTN31DRAFT_5063 [Thermomyces dupontii]|uniref:uncharacterized protein n=1 Tax=Talaromyces thermophilus TaxID=28565 RepID=UPI0037422E37